MEVLFEQNDIKFVLHKNFELRYLSPIDTYVQWKMQNNCYDDYNELNHAIKFIAGLNKNPDVWLDTHCLHQDNRIIGVLLIIGGDLGKLETKYEIKENSLLLKYFHIVERGQGHGRFWLNSVIFPHYRQKGHQNIYVNSSHEASFPFYRRFGALIATYTQKSDNCNFSRQGQCFLINI